MKTKIYGSFLIMGGALSGMLSAGCQMPLASGGKAAAEAANLIDVEQHDVADYHIKAIYRIGEGGTVEISKANRTVYRLEGHCLKIGHMADVAEYAFPKKYVGRDITGEGKPDIVIYEWTGGAHCEYIAYVIELGTSCRLVAEINGQHGVPCFRDMDGDGLPEVIIRDWAYAYWPVCFATSPAPQVILKWRHGKYEVATELMRTLIPTGNKLAIMAQRTRVEWEPSQPNKYDRDLIPESLFQTVLDLMYGGHEALGWQFIAMAWEPKYPMDTALLKELKNRMAESPYWQELIRGRMKEGVHK